MAYALRIHDIPASELAGHSARISGNAMLTMNRSSVAMKTATETTSRVRAGGDKASLLRAR